MRFTSPDLASSPMRMLLGFTSRWIRNLSGQHGNSACALWFKHKGERERHTKGGAQRCRVRYSDDTLRSHGPERLKTDLGILSVDHHHSALVGGGAGEGGGGGTLPTRPRRPER